LGVASYTDPDPKTKFRCETDGRRVHVGITGQDPAEKDFELRLPPDTRREILIKGRRDLTNRHIVGKAWHDHPEFIKGPAFLVIDYFFFPDRPDYQEQRAASQEQSLSMSYQVEDWDQAEIEFKFVIQPDKSVAVTTKHG
jgi:hypothetical protein